MLGDIERGGLFMTFRSAAQIVGGIIAAIILGAIGSGVWERFLAPASDATYRVLVGLISTVSLSYKDSIYEAAARGFNESYSLQLFSIFCLLLSLASLTALLTIHRSYGRLTRSLIDRYPRLLRIGVPVVLLTFAFFISLTVNRHDAIHETATFAVRSTDI